MVAAYNYRIRIVTSSTQTSLLFCICILLEDTGKKKKKAEPFAQSESDEIFEKLKGFAPVEAEDESADKGDA